MTLAYEYKNQLYLNITNQCSCACVFCIRNEHDGVGSGDSLWLEHEPSAQEVIQRLEETDLLQYDEIVFCGYGEPTERLDVMLEVSRYLKQVMPQLPIRVNTNGLSDLINGKPTAKLMQGLIDGVSISLNAPNAQRYDEITRPAFGEQSFAAMLGFAADCRKYLPQVRFTVVDVISDEEIAACEVLARQLDIPLRVRMKA